MDGAGAPTPSQDIAGENPRVNTGFQSTMEAGWWPDTIGEDLERWDHRRLKSTLPEPPPILSDEDNYEEHVRHLLEPVLLFVPPQETTKLPATSPLESPFPSQEETSRKLPATSPLESPLPS